jgi:alkane 1-monooxygenase
VTLSAIPWRHCFPFVVLAALQLAQRAGAIWMFLPALFVVFVGLDEALGIGIDEDGTKSALAHRCLPWLYIPLQLATTLWGVSIAAQPCSMMELLGLALAVGTGAGIFGMLAAHETVHGHHRFERALGLAMLASVGYMHFRISHVHGHHRLAATRADPATARAGESAYGFLRRSIVGQWHFAWRFEWRRAASRRWPALANRVPWYLASEAALALGVALVFGGRALLFLLLQAALAILILELFNYVAHYGLRRRVARDGRRERLAPHHSWNARQRFNNWALFNGGHHSDHHRWPGHAYYRLRAAPSAPQLPAGYAGTLLLALVPPLWRRVMAPRLAAAAAMSASSAAPRSRRLRSVPPAHGDRAA